MARAKKDFRALTVSEATNYGRKTAPMLRIQGLWLQELGFNIGDPVLVKCEDGKLIVMRDPEQTDLDEIEAAFMDKEMKAARKRFKEEKKGICAQYMAERKVGYGA